jgi:hypothetical protein
MRTVYKIRIVLVNNVFIFGLLIFTITIQYQLNTFVNLMFKHVINE